MTEEFPRFDIAKICGPEVDVSGCLREYPFLQILEQSG